MKFILGFTLLSQALGAMSPSTTVDSYLTTHLDGVGFTSVLTVGDGMTVPKTGSESGEMTQLVGIPDGLAFVDGVDMDPSESGFFYILANHELGSSQGGVREHGGTGAFVSKWKLSKETLEVVEGEDLAKEFLGWNWETEEWETEVTSFNRICSGDRPVSSALFNSATGLGTQEIMYFTGEESSGGRCLAHVVTGADAGKSFELAHLGYTAIENVVFNPFEQDLTIAAITDDSQDGEVYIYVGTKQAEGNDVEKAGLVGGNLYAIAVEGKPHELDDILDLRIVTGDRFNLKPIGTSGNRPIDGADTTARSLDEEGTYFPDSSVPYAALAFPGPEDSAWDIREGSTNNLYFVTKGGYFSGSRVNNLNAPSRLYRLEFDDITDPTLGGTIHIEYEALRSFDNIAIEFVNGEAKVYIQEDLGGETTLSKIYEYDILTGEIAEIAEFDPEIFYKGGSQFLTSNEESSGIISLKDVLGEGFFASSIQVHTSTGLPDSDVLVEHGQIVIFQIESDREADATHTAVINSGDEWSFRVDGADPGAEWASVGFATDDSWNTFTDGTNNGPGATPIGYGEGDGILRTNVGQPEEPRPAAYFFRKEFDLANPTDVISLHLLLLVDDGCVVYINGVEVARYNMDFSAPVTFETFAAANENAEKDWKQIYLTNFGDIELTETGNVLAVSMHQENNGSSDIRLDCRMTAIHKSTSEGTAPTAPVFASATALSFNEVQLQWEPQEGVKTYQLERQMDGDAAWQVIDHQLPGSFGSIIDNDVLGLATFNYRLVASNIHGVSSYSDIASVVVPENPVPTVFSEDFEEPDSFGQFTVVDVLGEDAGFSWVLWDFASNGAAQGNGFGGAGPTEDWLIMTNAINFGYLSGAQLLFSAQQSFSGPLPQILFSENYDPEVHADPNDAEWTLIAEDGNDEGEITPQGPFDLSEVANASGKIAWKYQSLGGEGGQSTRYTLGSVEVKAVCGFDFEGAENVDIEGTLGTWTVVNRNSAFGWIYDTYAENQGAINNNFGSEAGGELGGVESEDWLVGPAFSVSDSNFLISFDYYERFGDTIEKPLTLYITDNYTGDVTTTEWIDVTPENLNGSTDDAWINVKTTPLPVQGDNIVLAFLYLASGTGGGTTKRIGIDKVCVEQDSGPLEGEFKIAQNGAEITVTSAFSGGAFPYECSIDFGNNGESTTDCNAVYFYSGVGEYELKTTVVDAAGETITSSSMISVTQLVLPPKDKDVRAAAYNTAFSELSGNLADLFATPDNSDIKAIAEVIQFAQPDILSLNEFDHVWSESGEFDLEATLASVASFQENYLSISQNGQEPITYEHVFVAPCNTGVPSGYDLDNNGNSDDANDAYGFGEYPGQYSLVFLSKYPIVEDKIRTFQKFLWKDMPGALLPEDPQDSDGDGDTSTYYNATELEIFRLSSKSHWDVPVEINGRVYHILQSHPTPPVFDDGELEVYPGGEIVDWNGLRNHDEIRFWADYISGEDYMYDDEGNTGGLSECDHFIIMGDQNADPVDGDSTFNPILLVLDNEKVDSSFIPSSESGGVKTASFNLRVDYALPSKLGWTVNSGAVVWPKVTDIEHPFLAASDHRLVFVDATLNGGCDGDGDTPTPAPQEESPTKAPTEEESPTRAPTSGTIMIGFSAAMFCGMAVIGLVL